MSAPRETLGSLCHIQSGGTPRRDNAAFWGGDIPWVTITDMRSGVIDDTDEHITSAGLAGSSAKRFASGTILLSIFATIGRTAVLNIEAATNQAIAGLQIKDPERLDSRYLRRYLDFLAPQLANRGRGVAQANINLSILRSTKVPLPPMKEQRRIAAILDKADALRAKRREAIAKLDQLLQSFFLDMFGDPVKNPRGWPIHRISDLLESVKYGSSAKASLEGDVPILRMNNLTYSGEMDLADLKYITTDQAEEKYLVKSGDILFNRTNSKELVGKTAVYIGPTPMAYAGYLVRGRVLEGHVPEYISAFLNSPCGKAILRNMCKNIVGMANINAKEFGSIELPVPPSHLQVRFQKGVQAIRERKHALQRHATRLDALFASLQQRAFADTL